mgnify:FL=1
MFKSHYGMIVTVVLSIMMGIIMALVAVMVDGLAFNFSNVFKIWAMITLVILLVSIFIPYKKWGEKSAAGLRLKEGTLAFKLASAIIPTLILNSFITVIVSAANILYNEAIPQIMQSTVLLAGILHDWPIMLVISYFAAFLSEAAGKSVAGRYAEI